MEKWILIDDAVPEIESTHSQVCVVTLQDDAAQRRISLGRYWYTGEWEVGDMDRGYFAEEGEVIAWMLLEPYSKPIDVCRTCILSDTPSSDECSKCGGKDEDR